MATASIGASGVDAGQGGDLGSVALQWIAGDRRARIVMAADLAVRWASEQAQALIAEKRGLALRNGMLWLDGTEQHLRFVEFVASLGKSVKSLVLAEKDGGLVFRGIAMEADGERLACLELICADTQFAAEYCDFGPVFRLTPAETRTAMLLLRGLRAAEIASMAKLSIGTVRTHIRHIYPKVGARSREELVWRLAPYRIV
jgi:DNA-binding CsgD family transcriptional regulator